MKLIKLLPQIMILLLLIVLVLNNMQKVEFNLYGIYIWHLPLILIVIIALLVGTIIGFSLRLVKLASLKLEIHSLKKQLEKSANK